MDWTFEAGKGLRPRPMELEVDRPLEVPHSDSHLAVLLEIPTD